MPADSIADRLLSQARPRGTEPVPARETADAKRLIERYLEATIPPSRSELDTEREIERVAARGITELLIAQYWPDGPPIAGKFKALEGLVAAAIEELRFEPRYDRSGNEDVLERLGTVIYGAGHTRPEPEEIAGWRRDIELAAGTYPVDLRDSKTAQWTVPGTIVREYPTALLGGVSVGESLRCAQIGEPRSYQAQSTDSVFADQIIDARPGANREKFTLDNPGFEAMSYRFESGDATYKSARLVAVDPAVLEQRLEQRSIARELGVDPASLRSLAGLNGDQSVPPRTTRLDVAPVIHEMIERHVAESVATAGERVHAVHSALLVATPGWDADQRWVYAEHLASQIGKLPTDEFGSGLGPRTDEQVSAIGDVIDRELSGLWTSRTTDHVAA